MNREPKSKNEFVDVVTTEDMDFLRELMGLPEERKVLARGIILGLSLAAQVSSVNVSRSSA
ncbi:MAG: hypothetical protein HFF69_06235 [Oscillospiraceae bacterium]|nr:hypothetical protein [Oscillospiraceae bacterium]